MYIDRDVESAHVGDEDTRGRQQGDQDLHPQIFQDPPVSICDCEDWNGGGERLIVLIKDSGLKIESAPSYLAFLRYHIGGFERGDWFRSYCDKYSSIH